MGTPNTDNAETVRLLRYCGGGGAGFCIAPLGVTGVMLAYRVPKFITHNRKILFQNREFHGVRIFTDGGAAGLCPNSALIEVPWHMGLTSDSGANIEATAKAGYQLSGALPYDVEFPADMCPQPIEATWGNIIYVAVFWGSGLLLNDNSTGTVITTSFDLKKHDKDTKQ